MFELSYQSPSKMVNFAQKRVCVGSVSRFGHTHWFDHKPKLLIHRKISTSSVESEDGGSRALDKQIIRLFDSDDIPTQAFEKLFDIYERSVERESHLYNDSSFSLTKMSISMSVSSDKFPSHDTLGRVV